MMSHLLMRKMFPLIYFCPGLILLKNSYLKKMPFHRIKQSRGYKENKTNPWSSLRKLENFRKLESLIDEKLQRRLQTWCRACASEHCCLEARREETCNGSDENYAARLHAIKDKRTKLENYMYRVDQLINVCQDHILHARNLSAPRSQLPDWLIVVLKKDLTLPLVPTFPISAAAFETLHSDMGLDETNGELLEEYVRAGSFVRRVKVNFDISLLGNEAEGNLGFDKIVFTEEISRGSGSQDEVKWSTKLLTEKEDRLRVLENIPSSRSMGHTSETCEKTKVVDHHRIGLRALEKQLMWTVAYCCIDAKIEEYGAQRACIKGQFQVEPDKSDTHSGLVCLPFKLVLLFDSRAGNNVRVKGTYSRRSTVSRFDLRWKYDVDFHITI
ncbi:hypothetical protein Btru_003140 [Bulinus truncatus]|nr:hypothetical protein Btru_003140 [Bulinus truncatus]